MKRLKIPAFEPITFEERNSSVEVIDLDVTKIKPDLNQARKFFDEDSITELSSSIRQYGVIQPIIVSKEKGKDIYVLIAGERRWRAARLAGLSTLPAVVKEYSKPESLAVALIENIQRENLNPLEEAQAIQDLISECSFTHEEVANKLGKSRPEVSNLIRLLQLPENIKELVKLGKIEKGHAKTIAKLPFDKQLEIVNLILKEKLSVRKTEEFVKKAKNKKLIGNEKSNLNYKNEIERWNKELSTLFSANCSVSLNNNGGGKISIEIESTNKIEWILNNLTIAK